MSGVLYRAASAAAWLVAAPLATVHVVHAQQSQPVRTDSAVTIVGVKVFAEKGDAARVTPLQLSTLPAISTITMPRVIESVNLLDTQDAMKYMPTIFLRKRNNGDTQATVGTRTWGTSSGARSLVFADGVPLSALIANNNTIGAPRWGLVGPAEVARIDMMFGPWSAAYAGNSMGAVIEITTRMPEKREGSISQIYATQAFDLYGTSKRFGTAQTTASLGDRFGKFSYWLSGNYQKSNSQPLAYVTSASFPTGTQGGFAEGNKLGAAANVLGATGLLSTDMINGKVKLAYDLTSTLRASYTAGLWTNDSKANPESYLTKSGTASFGGQSGFATATNRSDQRHLSQSLSLRTSDVMGNWDWELVGSAYRFDRDVTRSPLTASADGLTFGSAGRIADASGTGWQTLDTKGVWHKGGIGSEHTVSFGAHADSYKLKNPTLNAAEWTSGAAGTIATEGSGNTASQALWIQDAWSISPNLKVTLGGRFENWRAFDGVNVNGNTRIEQQDVSASRFSPKAIVAFTPNDDWTLTLSAAKAYRFPTTAELYQLVSTGTTFTSPSPDLKPDDVTAAEFRAERRFPGGRMQVALFVDDVHDAITSQFLPLVQESSQLFSYLSNVDHVRSQGVEMVFGMGGFLTRGLEFSSSLTYTDARTLALSGRPSASAPADAAIGKFLPNIPRWRGTFAMTYRSGEKLSYSFAGRYSDKVFTTLDNADVNPNVYQGFSGWFVADTKVAYRPTASWTGSIGIDNVFNRKYFLFHPFPQRTIVGSVSYAF